MTRYARSACHAHPRANRSRQRMAEAHMQKCWLETGQIKCEAVCEWLDNNLGTDKLNIFVHHDVMMNAIEAWCKANKIAYIRVDGKTPVKKRQKLLE